MGQLGRAGRSDGPKPPETSKPESPAFRRWLCRTREAPPGPKAYEPLIMTTAQGPARRLAPGGPLRGRSRPNGRRLFPALLAALLLAAAASAAQTTQRNAGRDIDTLAAAGNHHPFGLWGDGETLWVADFADAKLYAYALGTGERQPDRDIETPDAESPTGIWSDGDTIWVLSYWGGVFAYDLASGGRLGARDRPGMFLEGGMGLWADGETAWIADNPAGIVRAYAWDTGAPKPERDFDSLAAGNANVYGVWSDGLTLWATDWSTHRLYAYAMGTREHLPDRELALGGAGVQISAQGVWSDGETIWVSDGPGSKIWAFAVPQPPALDSLELTGVELDFHPARHEYSFVASYQAAVLTVTASPAQDTHAVTVTPADAEPDVPGHQVALPEGSADFAITVTVAAPGQTATRTYTVNVERAPASAEAHLTALSVDGVAIGALTPGRRVYRGLTTQSVVTVVAVAAAHAQVAITPADTEPETPGHQVAVTANGATSVTITVTAENGNSEVYRVDLIRLEGARATPVLTAKPNVVIILADDLGYGDVSVMNPGGSLMTPNIDTIADEGMRFTDAHSGSSVCSPSRYALLTGRYTWRTRWRQGVLRGLDPALIDSDTPTLGNLLGRHGYRSAAIGKWHLGMGFPRIPEEEKDHINRGIDFDADIEDGPLDRGFDEFFGLSGNIVQHPHAYIRDRRVTAVPDQPYEQPEDYAVTLKYVAPGYEPLEVLDRLTEEAVAFINRAAAADDPFFLYFSLNAPHTPLMPAARFRGTTGLGDYGDFVAHLDWVVGEVIRALEGAGVAENTLLLFTSDNGSRMRAAPSRDGDHVANPSNWEYWPGRHRSNGPWRGVKGDVYEGGSRVPFLVRWPAVVPADSVHEGPVGQVDLYATLAQILNQRLQQGEAVDSESMLGALRGGTASRRTPIVQHSARGMFTIREGPWKLILGNGSGGWFGGDWHGTPFRQPYRLYDLVKDPGETTNHLGRERELAQQLEDSLSDIRSTSSRSDMFSDDASLSGLAVGGVAVAGFSGDVTTHSVEVASSVSTVLLTALASDPAATVVITDADGSATGWSKHLTLSESATAVTVTVTAEDMVTTRDYTVTLNRAGEGSGLGLASAAVTVTASPTTIAEGESATVTVTVGGGITFDQDQSLTVSGAGSATAADYALTPATLTLSAGTSSATTQLTALADAQVEGPEMVTLTVSHGGAPVGTATVTITSVSRDTTLGSLSLSGMDIGTFSAETSGYAASVGAEVASTTVTAAAADAGATVAILPADADPGTPGHQVSLAAGANVITVTVTAADGGAERTYTVTVTRAADLPVVSVSAVSARVSEAESAQFRLTRTGSTDEELAVAVGGTWSDGTEASVQRPRFLAGRNATTAGFRRADNEVSGERTLTVRVEEGTGYAVSAAAGSAVVVVEDDDAAVFAVSVEPAEVPAGGTATLRVSIGNGVTFTAAQTLVVEASSASVAMTVQAPRGPGEIGLAAGASAATAELWVVEGAAAEEVVTLTVRHGGAEVGSAELRVSAGAPAPLTGRFEEVPATHDGETAFTFELHFSEEPRLSYLTLRDEAFEVTGGGVERARRLLPPSNLGWEITVAPATTGEVVVLLGATADCAAAGAVCTSGGKKLTGEVTARVRGPASETAGFSLAPENAWPGGLWSDGETAWVADVEDGRVYAYRLADGSRVPERDVAAGGAPVGLWSDGATLWVADAAGGGVAAYRLVDGTRAAARDLAAVSGAPVGVWSDGETAWVAEWLGERVFAVRLSDGTRAPERDVLLSGENLLPVGLWSDGATLWVADWGERVFAYRLLDGSRESERDVVLPEGDGDPSGLWSDGEVLLVTGWGGAEVRSRPLPAGLAEGSAAVMSVGGWSAGVPPVADAGLRAALAAALGGSGAGGLAELEVLEARGRGIRSLAGLSGAVRLRELDLGFNPLEEVGALGQLPALVSLNLDGTGLAPGSLGYLPGLEKLSLRGNGLDELGALTLLPGLVELDVGENGLADLGPLAGLRGLRVLRADRNRLADAGPLASVPGLRVADLGRNRLRTLSGLSGAGSLRALRLDGNGALDLTALGGLAGLSELGLAGTGVEELGALSGLTGLVRLDLRGARVRDLGPLRGLAALSWVHVGGSAVEDLGPLRNLPGLTLAGRDDRETVTRGKRRQ